MLTQKIRQALKILPTIIGRSKTALDMIKFAKRVANTKHTIFIRGETGVGKDLLAECIHAMDASGQEFVTVDCGAIPDTLCETELFGHVSGAFTDAGSTKIGLIQMAAGGTLFLDEIGNMPLGLQAKLLHVIEERNFRPVGGTKAIPINTRIIAATNANVEQAVDEGKIRKDLYYRLNVIPYVIPPLRDRQEDIADLALHFLNGQREEITFSNEAITAMENHPWPGNIRELKHTVARTLFFTSQKEIIHAEDIEPHLTLVKSCGNSAQDKIGAIQKLWHGNFPNYIQMEEWYFSELMEQTGGNKSKAARLSGLVRATINDKIEKYNL